MTFRLLMTIDATFRRELVYHGDLASQVIAMLTVAKLETVDLVEWPASRGTGQSPFGVQSSIKIETKLHAQLAAVAKARKVSVNRLLNSVIAAEYPPGG
jgi:hypothetical protein